MFEELINRYRGSGILLDSNVLLLYCIGRFDRARISAFKRTAKYSVENYDRLARLVSLFPRIATLPHVLAEVNSLSSLAPGTLVSSTGLSSRRSSRSCSRSPSRASGRASGPSSRTWV